jgi:hypothetical protein
LLYPLRNMEKRHDPDPTLEDAYWRENYRATGLIDPTREYEYYQPAYRFGWESYSRYGRRSFEEIDEALQDEWEKERGPSSPDWSEARGPARDAWDRVARHERPVVENEPGKATPERG